MTMLSSTADMEITAVASYSGGISSWAAAKRWTQEHGTDNFVLLFADALAEHWTTYRFMIQGAANIFGVQDRFSHLCEGLPAIDPAWGESPGPRCQALDDLYQSVCKDIPGLIRIRDGRNPWQVFADVRFMGNSSADPCSKILKRELMDKWRSSNAPNSASIVGLDYTETARFGRFATRVPSAAAPLMDEPYIDKDDMLEWAKSEGLQPGVAYEQGFNHDNCSLRCCKAGQGHWAKVCVKRPDEFEPATKDEEYLRSVVGDHSYLTDRRGGDGKKVLTLPMLANRVATGDYIDRHEIGGCACAIE